MRFMGFEQLVPEHIRRAKVYVAGKSLRQAEAESGIRCIKLASNENPYGPSPAAIEAIRANAHLANFYPETQDLELTGRIAEELGLTRDEVLVTPGSTAFLDIICRTLLAPGLNAVTSKLSFIVYPVMVRAAGGTLIEVPMRDYAFDLDGVLAAITPETRIVFIANPNNPTGTLVPADEVTRFLDRVPEHLLVVLDEAYCDFAGEFAMGRGIEYSHALRHVREGRRVVVLRTFSKAHGLAGLRVGYGFGPAEIISVFARVRTVFSVSGLAETAALAAMRDHTHLRHTLRCNAEGAEWLLPRLRELGLRPVPTFANFIYFEVAEPAKEIAARLQREGIIVRPLTAWGAPNALRVTIGSMDQNRAFLDALQRCLAAALVR